MTGRPRGIEQRRRDIVVGEIIEVGEQFFRLAPCAIASTMSTTRMRVL